MAGAGAQLDQAYGGPIDVDAEVGRSFAAGIEVVRARAEAGTLGDVLVVHLGNNGIVEPKQVARLMEVAGSERSVIFLTVRVPRRWQDLVNAALAKAVPPHDNAKLVDWYTHSEGRRAWFNADGIHIVDTPGAEAYAKMIARAVRRSAG